MHIYLGVHFIAKSGICFGVTVNKKNRLRLKRLLALTSEQACLGLMPTCLMHFVSLWGDWEEIFLTFAGDYVMAYGIHLSSVLS